MPSGEALHVHRSNSSERLADSLAALLESPGIGPLEPECVVVQGRGMATWLMLELSRRFGVFANAEFPFPRRFIQRAFAAVLEDESLAAQAGAEERLRWLVLSELHTSLTDPKLAKLARYLGDDVGGLKRFQLARQIARTFDQYLTYRPDLVLDWERGGDGGVPEAQRWQPVLWRALAPKLSTLHIAALERRFAETLRGRERGSPIAGLPGRIAVFGISGLPPLYVRVLAALARHLELHFFLLAPGPDTLAASALGADRGPVSYARPGREFFALLDGEARAARVELAVHAEFREPDAEHLLARLQRELYGKPGAATTLAADDCSVTIHACHGAMREVEVLHDQLLDVIARPNAARPHEVVVMMPDVELYAPLIEAVFQRDPNDETFIPYRIADRALAREAPVIDAFERLLALVGGRATASELIDFLTLEPVRRRFAIAADELDQITAWVVDSGIRWGIDAEHRAVHGQPPFEENTWRFGLRRLLLGYAVGGDDALFHGVLPFDAVEGQAAGLVGQLAEFCERVFRALSTLSEPRLLGAWQADLTAALHSLIHEDAENAWQHQRIRAALAELSEEARVAGFAEPVELAVVRKLLEEKLDDSGQARGFLAGGVTFCAMVPMRSVPFRVVCLIGMSDDRFPRTGVSADFDLMASSGEARRPGDRSRRDDDRQLFLEALLAARERLIITYTGQSVRDNARRPPSVVVSELVDQLIASFGSHELCLSTELDEDGRLFQFHAPLFVRHPLQAFSPRYFDASDPRLFSYAGAYCQGARSLRPGPRPPRTAFVTEALPAPAVLAGATRTLAVQELLRFFENPTAYFLNRRLELQLREQQIDVPDREPWELDALERWVLATRRLALELDGRGANGYELARASGALPLGSPGRTLHDGIAEDAERIARLVKECRGGRRAPNLTVNRLLPNGWLLTGELGDRWAKGGVIHVYSRLRGRYVLSAWIRHLVSCWVLPKESERSTFLIGRCRTAKLAERKDADVELWRWDEVEEPLAHLESLCELFEHGESRPLPLLPSASFSYACSVLEKGDEAAARRAALEGWGDRYQPGERNDPHLQRVFGNAYEPGSLPPFEVLPGHSFEELARRVFGPALEHRRREA